MPLYLGTIPLTLKYGALNLTGLYKGSTPLWTPGGIIAPFTVDGILDPLVWEQDGGAGYPIGVENGLARVLMADNVPLISLFARRARYIAAQHQADGHVEIVVGNPGSGSQATDVFRRATNGSTNAAGAGIRLRSSGLFIARRVGSADTEMVPCGEFQGGDRVRLTQVGNLHTMHRNGRFVGEWNDVGGTALNTAAERTLTLVQRGYKDFTGPRRFSPSIDSIECV